MKAPLLSLLTSLALWLSPLAQAQPSFNPEVFQGVRGWYTPGFTLLDSASFNAATTDAGYGNLSPVFISQGGGAHVILDRIILGAAFQNSSGFRTVNAKGEALAVQGGHGLFQLGYLLVNSGPFSLYPVLGIGSGSTSIRATGALNTLFGLSRTEAIEQIDSTQVLLDLGLGADYMIDFNGDTTQASGLLVGLRAGYLWVASPPQWESGRQIISGSRLPQLNQQGLYLQLTLGAGTQRSPLPTDPLTGF